MLSLSSAPEDRSITRAGGIDVAAGRASARLRPTEQQQVFAKSNPCCSNPSRFLIGALAIALCLCSCTTETKTPVDAGVSGLEDVVFSDGLNDEALAELLAHPVAVVEGQGAAMDLPGENSAVSASSPPTFAWHIGATARVEPSLLQRLWGVIGVQDAYAHGTEVNGKAYFLVVSSASNPKHLRAFTQKSTFTPEPAAWAKVKAGAGTGALTAVVVTGVFDTGKLAAGGGPYAGKPVHFTLVP